MKRILIFAVVFISNHALAQSTLEPAMLNLSKKIFAWEVTNQTDSLANIFDDKLSVVNSRGEVQRKEQYLAVLRSGAFLHDSIHIEMSKATVVNSTAIVIGKGIFYITTSGNKIAPRLSYMEVFAKYKKGWKLIALYASALPD